MTGSSKSIRDRSGGFPVPLGDEVDALLHQGEHAEREEVDLDEARVLARILVPLAEEAAFPRRRLEGDDLHERPAGDDHAAHVLRDVARQAGHVLGELTRAASRGVRRPDP